jgi:A/G-specific adenine glycosylase
MMEQKVLSRSQIAAFQKVVFDFYHTAGRHDLPWRQPDTHGFFDPYAITVSEIMLQQTQVNRVLTKYLQFMSEFPTVSALSAAPLSEVIKAWAGLGYYRRARYLHQAAQAITGDCNGMFPQEVAVLMSLPGIGKNTAGAIAAYSFNLPVVFIETNIRTVYLHHFFQDQVGISDAALLPLVQQTLPENMSRIWYWALMDYGSHLKSTVSNPSRRSSHYTRQSQFKGSRREVRGQIIRKLTESAASLSELKQVVSSSQLESVLDDLVREGMISSNNTTYQLGK